MSKNKPRIAVLDHPRTTSPQNSVSKSLDAERLDVLSLEDLQALHQISQAQKIDCIVVSVGNDADFLHAVEKQKTLSLIDCPSIIVVGSGEVEIAIDAIRMGAYDVLAQPMDDARLHQSVDQALELKAQTGFTCEDEGSHQLLALADRVARTDVTVLINGESGTGKEVLAKHIHQRSPRASEAFVAVNCASIPESMLEDMLFGHEKGAFTGAHQRHEGLFEQAHKGTIFLDEIGEMPLILQSKILRVLQERELRRLGGSDLIKVDVRVIAATNRDLADHVRKREFREDLFYRLNVFPLKISALRDRIGDILPIAKALMKKYQGSIGKGYRLSKETKQFFQHYPWPGNVRELENVVQRAMVLASDGLIEIEHLLLDGSNGVTSQQQEPEQTVVSREPYVDRVIASEREQIDRVIKASAPIEDEVYEDFDSFEEQGADLSDVTWRSESKVIIDTLSRYNGNRKNTAEKLGISPRTLRYKLARLKDQGVAIP